MKTNQPTNKSQPVIVSFLRENIVLGPISYATKMFAATLRIAKMLQGEFPEPFPTEGTLSQARGAPSGPSPGSAILRLGGLGSPRFFMGRVPPAARTREAQPGPHRESSAMRRTGSTRGVGVCTQFLKLSECLAESEPQHASQLPTLGTPPAPAFLEGALGHVLGFTHHCSMHTGCGWHLPMAYSQHWHLPPPWMPHTGGPSYLGH